jgi:hypothetical protein
MEIPCLYCAAAVQETKVAPLSTFFSLQILGHLKLHAVGDVDLSHSLGIDFGCAGYESEFDCNADGWYD